jgi:hypothetical protein
VKARFIAGFLAISLLAAAGCGATATSPSPLTSIRVTVVATPTFVGIDGAMFTLRVENIGTAAVDLTFPSSCQVLPYFVDRATGQPVTPVGGGFACLTVITKQTLSPGQSFAQVHTVKAGSTPLPQTIVLPPGDYSIYARLEDATLRLTSDPIPFSVR